MQDETFALKILNDAFGSQVAIGHPRMDFIGWTAGIGHNQSLK
jgi:hypothetical protein